MSDLDGLLPDDDVVATLDAILSKIENSSSEINMDKVLISATSSATTTPNGSRKSSRAESLHHITPKFFSIDNNTDRADSRSPLGLVIDDDGDCATTSSGGSSTPISLKGVADKGTTSSEASKPICAKPRDESTIVEKVTDDVNKSKSVEAKFLPDNDVAIDVDIVAESRSMSAAQELSTPKLDVNKNIETSVKKVEIPKENVVKAGSTVDAGDLSVQNPSVVTKKLRQIMPKKPPTLDQNNGLKKNGTDSEDSPNITNSSSSLDKNLTENGKQQPQLHPPSIMPKLLPRKTVTNVAKHVNNGSTKVSSTSAVLHRNTNIGTTKFRPLAMKDNNLLTSITPISTAPSMKTETTSITSAVSNISSQSPSKNLSARAVVTTSSTTTSKSLDSTIDTVMSEVIQTTCNATAAEMSKMLGDKPRKRATPRPKNGTGKKANSTPSDANCIDQRNSQPSYMIPFNNKFALAQNGNLIPMSSYTQYVFQAQSTPSSSGSQSHQTHKVTAGNGTLSTPPSLIPLMPSQLFLATTSAGQKSSSPLNGADNSNGKSAGNNNVLQAALVQQSSKGMNRNNSSPTTSATTSSVGPSLTQSSNTSGNNNMLSAPLLFSNGGIFMPAGNTLIRNGFSANPAVVSSSSSASNSGSSTPQPVQSSSQKYVRRKSTGGGGSGTTTAAINSQVSSMRQILPNTSKPNATASSTANNTGGGGLSSSIHQQQQQGKYANQQQQSLYLSQHQQQQLLALNAQHQHLIQMQQQQVQVPYSQNQQQQFAASAQFNAVFQNVMNAVSGGGSVLTSSNTASINSVHNQQQHLMSRFVQIAPSPMSSGSTTITGNGLAPAMANGSDGQGSVMADNFAASGMPNIFIPQLNPASFSAVAGTPLASDSGVSGKPAKVRRKRKIKDDKNLQSSSSLGVSTSGSGNAQPLCVPQLMASTATIFSPFSSFPASGDGGSSQALGDGVEEEEEENEPPPLLCRDEEPVVENVMEENAFLKEVEMMRHFIGGNNLTQPIKHVVDGVVIEEGAEPFPVSYENWPQQVASLLKMDGEADNVNKVKSPHKKRMRIRPRRNKRSRRSKAERNMELDDDEDYKESDDDGVDEFSASSSGDESASNVGETVDENNTSGGSKRFVLRKTEERRAQKGGRFVKEEDGETAVAEVKSKQKKKKLRAKRRRELEGLLTMDFGPGKTPFQTTSLDKYTQEIMVEAQQQQRCLAFDERLVRRATSEIADRTTTSRSPSREERKNGTGGAATKRSMGGEKRSNGGNNNSKRGVGLAKVGLASLTWNRDDDRCLACGKSFSETLPRCKTAPQYCSRQCKLSKKQGNEGDSITTATGCATALSPISTSDNTAQLRRLQPRPSPTTTVAELTSEQRASTSVLSPPATPTSSASKPSVGNTASAISPGTPSKLLKSGAYKDDNGDGSPRATASLKRRGGSDVSSTPLGSPHSASSSINTGTLLKLQRTSGAAELPLKKHSSSGQVGNNDGTWGVARAGPICSPSGGAPQQLSTNNTLISYIPTMSASAGQLPPSASSTTLNSPIGVGITQQFFTNYNHQQQQASMNHQFVSTSPSTSVAAPAPSDTLYQHQQRFMSAAVAATAQQQYGSVLPSSSMLSNNCQSPFGLSSGSPMVSSANGTTVSSPAPGTPLSTSLPASNVSSAERDAELDKLVKRGIVAWTPDDVARWTTLVTGADANGERLLVQEIDGVALLMMELDELKQLVRLGPAMKLNGVLTSLRARMGVLAAAAAKAMVLPAEHFLSAERRAQLDALLSRGIQSWTTQDAAIWAQLMSGSVACGTRFMEQEIDGFSLLLLDIADSTVVKTLGLRIGPAKRLGAALNALKSKLGVLTSMDAVKVVFAEAHFAVEKRAKLAELMQKGVRSWGFNDVATWANIVTRSETCGEWFVNEEIDGDSLVCFKEQQQPTDLGVRLGSAVKLHAALSMLNT